MRSIAHFLFAVGFAAAIANPASAQGVKVVGGAAMYPTKTIVDNAVNSRDHTTLVAAVKAAGLVDTLQGPGPFTVFAPTNKAFAKLPAGTVETLVMPQNKQMLTSVLTYHVVPGRYTGQDLMRLVDQGGGQARLTTAQGGALTVLRGRSGKSLFIEDNKGNTSRITISNVMQANGVIHVVDTVVMPN